MSRLARGLLAVAAVVLLAGCRLDVDVGMTMNADGSGELVVTAVVDAAVVAAAEQEGASLADVLLLPDAQEAGWTTEGPTATDDGGLTVTARHAFTNALDATNLLRSVGPPLNVDILITRTASEDEVTVTVAGTASLSNGSFNAFADGSLVQLLGGVPFADQIATSGVTPSQAMSVDLTLRLPGKIEQSTGDRNGGRVTWRLPLDGSSTDLTTRAVLQAGGGSSWARPVAIGALVLLIAWLLAAAAFVVRVIQVRNRRNRRRGRGGPSPYVSDRYR